MSDSWIALTFIVASGLIAVAIAAYSQVRIFTASNMVKFEVKSPAGTQEHETHGNRPTTGAN